MNILVVNLILHTPEKGIIPKHATNHDCMIYTLCRGLVATGHDVTLAAAQEYRPEQPDAEDFKVVYLPSRMAKVCKPYLFPWPRGLKTLVKNGKFDVIISSEIFSIASLIAVRAAKNIPVVIWQELAMHQRKMKRIPSRIWYNVVAPLFMRRGIVVGRSETARDFAKQYLTKVREPLVDNVCNSSIFYPGNESDESFIIISQLIERKQPVKMLNAFIEFIRRPGRDKYKLHVVGRGALLEEMKRLVAENGAQNNVIFHGFLAQHEFAAIGRRARAMLINTKQDLNMVSIPEAIVNGTPILMNTVPYTAGFVNDAGVGIAKEDWGADELEMMADNYNRMHAACVQVGKSLTEMAGAKKLVELAFSEKY